MAKVILPVVDQADIELYSGHLGRQLLCLMQIGKGWFPLPAAHVNHAQICIGSGGSRVDRQHPFEAALRLIEISPCQGGFACGKNALRVLSRPCGRSALGLNRIFLFATSRSRGPTRNPSESYDDEDNCDS